jgi:transposase-like protein
VSGPAPEPAGERQVPFYCPYCGEEALRPTGPATGQWECADCGRGFELRFTGVIAPAQPFPPQR